MPLTAPPSQALLDMVAAKANEKVVENAPCYLIDLERSKAEELYGEGCHVTATSLPRHCHVTATSLTPEAMHGEGCRRWDAEGMPTTVTSGMDAIYDKFTPPDTVQQYKLPVALPSCDNTTPTLVRCLRPRCQLSPRSGVPFIYKWRALEHVTVAL